MSILSDDFEGIWISPEIVSNDKLNWNEKTFLAGLNYVENDNEFLHLCTQHGYPLVYGETLVEKFKEQELLPKNFEIC